MAGKIYFAEVDPGEPFNPAVHNREDQDVFAVTISQDENQFAVAEVEYINPGAGLLNPTRKKRVYISEDVGGTAELIFAGRIVGYPNDLSGKTIKVTYLAQPENWEDTQNAFFDTLKVAPYYNDLLVSESRRDIEGDILAGYSSLIYWDRIDETIKLSDIIEGDELINIGDNFFFDTLRTRLGDPPLQKINLNVETQWQQFGVGEVDVGSAITAAFTNTVTSPQINTLTPFAFEDGWKGVRIPTGYTILKNKLTATANDFGLSNSNLRSGIITVLAADFPTKSGGTAGNRKVSVPRVWYIGELLLQAVYKQKRRENMKVEVTSSIQDIALKKDKAEELFLRLQDPTAQAQGAVFSGKQPSFFTDTGTGELSTLGQEIVEHCLMRARARLIKTARVVEVQFECSYDLAREITTDKSVRIIDDRLPGGSLRGKVTSYVLNIDGDSGQSTGKIRIASTIGLGLSSEASGAPNENQVGAIGYDNEFGSINPDIDGYTPNGQSDVLTSQSNVDGIFWRDDGTSYYVNDESALIRQYDCPSPFNINSASHDNSKRMSFGSDKRGLYIKPDGIEFFYCDGDIGFGVKRIRSGRASTSLSLPPWEIGNITQGLQNQDISGEMTGSEIPVTIDFSFDGVNLLVGGNQGTLIHYELSTPWDMSTRAIQNTYNAGSSLQCARWNEDGTKIFYTRVSSEIFQLDLSGPYNLSAPVLNGATFNSSNVQEFAFSVESDYTYMLYDSSSTSVFNSEKSEVTSMTSSIYYNLTTTPVIQNPIDVAQMEVDDQYLIDLVTIDGNGQSQVNLFLAEDIEPPTNGGGRPDLVLQNNPTGVTVDLKSMNPQAELQIDVEVTAQPLTLPKQTDLEAE